MRPSSPKTGIYPLYTAAQVREIDQQAIASGIPAGELMQRAGQSAFDFLHARWPDISDLLILCGRGNNGGDGYVVAELAVRAGLTVTVLSMGECNTGQASRMQASARQAGVQVLDYGDGIYQELLRDSHAYDVLIIDALLGTGSRGILRDAYASAVELSNNSALPVLAIDLPTGLDSDTGWTEQAIRASATISFIARKKGLFTGLAADYAGELHFADLQLTIPGILADQPAALAIDAGVIAGLLQPRARSAHKGNSGNVLIIGGDEGFGGAALMAAEAACRAGAGTVSLITRPCHVSAALSRRPEIMVLGLTESGDDRTQRLLHQLERASAIVLGPGLGQSEWSLKMLEQCMQWAVRREIPLVLDADALNLIARQAWNWQDSAAAIIRRNWVLTPHPGEAARLLGETVAEIQSDRYAAVSRLQQATGAVCLIKGAGTVIAFPERGGTKTPVEVCTEGNPGMASGGMGDVLAGILGALLAQGLSSVDATKVAVCAHGEAADLAARALGERGLLATDLMAYLPCVLNS